MMFGVYTKMGTMVYRRHHHAGSIPTVESHVATDHGFR
jgi:hypothetical protein